MHLKLSTDRKFALSDENYLFDCMGLTKTTSDELGKMFDRKIIDFLKRSELVQALPKQSETKKAHVQQQRSPKANSSADQQSNDPHGASSQVNTQHSGQMNPRHTPIHKFLPHQQYKKSIDGGLTNSSTQDCGIPKGYDQTQSKNAVLGYGGMPREMLGQDSVGTQHSSMGSHMQ